MQQTEKLKLNLIETGDPISPAPINQNTQALDGLVAGIADEQHLFKLREVPPLTEKGPISFDLSGVDLTQYDALYMILYLKYQAGIQFMGINGTGSVAVFYSGGSAEYYDGFSTVMMMPVADTVLVRASSFCAMANRDSNLGAETTGGRIKVAWQDVQTIKLNNVNLPIGSGGVLFGVKF